MSNRYTLDTKPPPVEVYRPGVDLKEGLHSPVGWLCGVCGKLWPGATLDTCFADLCCEPVRCEHCRKEQRLPGKPFCETCRPNVERARKVSKLRGAPRVRGTDWSGPVWHEPDEELGWHRSVADFYKKVSTGSRPSWVWGATILPRRFDAEALIATEHEASAGDEESLYEALDGQETLQALLDAWCASRPLKRRVLANVVVVLDEPRFAAEFPELIGAKP